MAEALVATTTVWVVNPDPKGTPQLLIEKGKSYAADHPLVKANPWAFDSPEGIIEAATAAPGEKRRTRRSGK